MKNNEAIAYSYEEKTVPKDLTSESLNTTLPLNELIGLFAQEISDVVSYDSFEYENSAMGIHMFRGTLNLHQCSYKIKTSGIELGEITLTRNSPFKEEEMAVIEKALGALSIHLRNAMDSESGLNKEKLLRS